MKTYTFKELSPQAQKIVIEGHTEYLNLVGNHKHTYTETVNNLNLNNYKFDEGGNRVREEENSPLDSLKSSLGKLLGGGE